MEDPGWQLILQFVGENKKAIVPIASVTLAGGLLYLYIKTLFGGKQIDAQDNLGILDLPPETRRCIWNYVAYKDILNLRLVCYDFKSDVDTLVGVHGYLRCDDESFPFFKNALLTKCIVADLNEAIEGSVIASPGRLEHLSIQEMLPLPLTIVHKLLKDCNNLRKLEMKFTFLPEGAVSTTEFLSRIMLELLPTKSKLRTFQFIKIPGYTRTDKIFGIGNSELHYPVTYLLNSIEVQLPDVPAAHLGDWKYFFEQQSKLSTLIVDFGGVDWNLFSDVISKNSATLTRICLHQLKCFNEFRDDVTPFDWGIFTNCHVLTRLRVTGFKWDSENMQSKNFYAFPTEKLTELFIKRVTLSRNDVCRIYEDIPNLQTSLLEDLGIEGDRAAIEMAINRHHTVIVERHYQLWGQNIRSDDYLSVSICVCGVISACLSLILAAQAYITQSDIEMLY